MKRLCLLLFLIMMSGCAATGSSYTDAVMKMTALEQNKSRLIIYWTKASIQYSARAASLKLDDQPIPSCSWGGFIVFVCQSGKHVLTTELPDVPGKCNARFEATPGEELYFEIRAREENLAAGLIGGLIGTAIESYGKDCGGAFSIEMVNKELANAKLYELKQSH